MLPPRLLLYLAEPIVRLLATLVSLAVTARYISHDEFGLAALCLTVFAIGPGLIEECIVRALVRREALDTAVASRALRYSLVFAVVTNFGGLALFLALASQAGFAPHRADVLLTALAGCAAVVFSALGARACVAAQRRLQHRALVTSSIMGVAFGLGAGTSISALLGLGMVAPLLGLALQYAISSATIWLWVRPVEPSPAAATGCVGRVAEFDRDTRLNALNLVAAYAAANLDRFLVQCLLGVDAVAWYVRAQQIASLPQRMLGPLIARGMYSEYLRGCKQSMISPRSILLWLGVMLVMSVLALPLAPTIVEVVLGPGWEPVVLPLQVLFISVPFRIIWKVQETILAADGSHLRRLLSFGASAAPMLIVAGQGLFVQASLVEVASALGAGYALGAILTLPFAGRSGALARTRPSRRPT